MSGYYNCSLILYFPDNIHQIMIITASTYFCLKNVFYIYRDRDTESSKKITNSDNNNNPTWILESI